MHDVIRQIIAELHGSWRFRLYAIISAWAVCLVGWTVVFALPDSYESEATVYVDTSSALRPLLDEMTIGSDVLGRVELVTRAMLGRPLLEKVARENDLHLRATNQNEMDELILDMRDRIAIQNDPRNEPNLYRIKYRDQSARTAHSVVSSMLNIFVEDSLGANRMDTRNAQEFLQEELDKLEVELERSEQELAEFKKRNVGRMPGEGGDYFQRLQQAMDGLDATNSSLRLATRKRDALRQQMAGEQPTLDSTVGGQSDLDVRISENETRLEELRLRYTDRHPDVVAVRRTLDQLRDQKEAQLAELRAGTGTGIASDNPVFQNIQIELTNVSVEIETLLEERATQERQIEELRELVDVLPQVEAELARLTRDYDVKQTQYQSLLQRLGVAELSESAEQSEDVQFRIIDPPFVPDSPAAPNRPLLLFGVLVAGLGAGGALAFFLNQLMPVFHDATSLRLAAGLPVIGSVSTLHTRERSRSRIRQMFGFGFSMVFLAAAFVGVVLFNEPASQYIQSVL